ncbi:MAG: aspartate aminotransferase family protein [Gammaproteobacteria bacterium]|nr:aspartate aminotransferase family protein [Rhodospirillaceae bacterium]MDE0367814.1 aspartate aminotransferase family protein [Gammaproteobacteria bacterium]
MTSLMNTYARLPVSFVKGSGATVEDSDGNTYLDALTGLAVCGLGHAHPAVAKAVSDQAETLLHTSNLYEMPIQAALAERLTALSGMDRAFFGNSGAEANEAAIKIARLHGQKRGIKSPMVVVTDQSFHGRTMATLTATGNRKAQAGFEPLLNGFVRAPFNDPATVEQIAADNPQIAAVLVEPVQGESGIRIPDDGYLDALRAICDANGWLLMLDEVQTGNGRTGRYFAYQHTGCLPDVVTTAKGLGNGIPIGVCLARGEAAELFQPGHHGSTFGGNFIACAAAHAVLDTIESENLIERAGQLGKRIVDGLGKALRGDNRIKEVRGKGLMIAVELNEPVPGLVNAGLERGILINAIGDTIVRLLPPLNLTDEEADEVVARVSAVIEGQAT